MLTHILPLVSKKFRSYSQSEYLWKIVLMRLVTNKPCLWGDGMRKFLYRPRTLTTLSTNHNIYMNEVDNNDQSNVIPFLDLSYNYNDDNHNIKAEKIVTDAGLFMEEILQTYDGFFTRSTSSTNTRTHCIFMELYRYILSQYIKFRSPLFYMPDQVEIGREFGIHFFEPRYRLLIAEVMSTYPRDYSTGEPITPLISKLLHNHSDPFKRRSSPYPTFIYANNSPLKPNSVVTIVEVCHCIIHENQTADVSLNPVQYGRIEEVRERPNSHHLYEAKVVRMSEEECYAFDQESNARLMEQRRQFQSVDRALQENQFAGRGDVSVNEYIHAMMMHLMQNADNEYEMDEDDLED